MTVLRIGNEKMIKSENLLIIYSHSSEETKDTSKKKRRDRLNFLFDRHPI